MGLTRRAPSQGRRPPRRRTQAESRPAPLPCHRGVPRSRSSDHAFCSCNGRIGRRRRKYMLSGAPRTAAGGVQVVLLLLGLGLALLGVAAEGAAVDPFSIFSPACRDQLDNCSALEAQGLCRSGDNRLGGLSVRDYLCAQTCHGLPCNQGCLDLFSAADCRLSLRQGDCETGAMSNGLSIRDVWCAKTCGGLTCNKGPSWCHDWIDSYLCSYLEMAANVCDPKFVINGLSVRDVWCAQTCVGAPCVAPAQTASPPPPPELGESPPAEVAEDPPAPPPSSPSLPPPRPPPPLPSSGGSVSLGPVCEEDLPVSLQCPLGMVIASIDAAFYGRSDSTTCPYRYPGAWPTFMRNTSCASPLTRGFLADLCVGLDECFPNVRGWLENPCPDTFKWLSVNFTCGPPGAPPPSLAPPPSTPDNGLGEGLRLLGPVCEWDPLPAVLQCPPRMVISAINQAFFGRSDPYTCPYNGSVSTATAYTACSSPVFPGTVAERCLGRVGCALQPPYPWQDTCLDTYKWMFLSYNCSYRSSVALAPPPPPPASDVPQCSACAGCDYGAAGSALTVLRGLPDHGACCRACAAEAACSFWVFNSVSGDCQLKADQGADPGFFRASSDDVVSGSKYGPLELGAASTAPWLLFSTGRVFPYDDQYDRWIWSSRDPAGAPWSVRPVFSAVVEVPSVTPALLYAVADDRADVFLNGHYAATVSGVGRNGANNHIGPNAPNAPVPLTLQPGRNLLSLACTNERAFITDAPDVKSSAGVMAVLLRGDDNVTVLIRTDRSWVMATRPSAGIVCPQKPGFSVAVDTVHVKDNITSVIDDPAAACQARDDCSGFSTGAEGEYGRGVLTANSGETASRPGYCFYTKMSDDDPPVRGMLTPCGSVGLLADMVLNKVPSPASMRWYGRGSIDVLYRLRFQFPNGRMSNGRNAMTMACLHAQWQAPQLYVEFSRSFPIGDGLLIVLEQQNRSCPNKWVPVKRYSRCGDDSLCRYLFQDGVPPVACDGAAASGAPLPPAAAPTGTAVAYSTYGRASSSDVPLRTLSPADLRTWAEAGANINSEALATAPTSPPSLPLAAGVPDWSHSCQVAIRGGEDEPSTGSSTAPPPPPPVAAALSIRCWANPATAAAAQQGAALVDVSLGAALAAAMAANAANASLSGYNTVPQLRQQLAGAPSSSPLSAGAGAADWGVTFLNVPHLRLVDSVLSDLPLSSVAPLLQCLNCSYFTLQNVAIQRLAGVPRPASGAAPARPAHGAVQATGLVSAGVVDVTCSEVRNAHGWSCLHLVYGSGAGSNSSGGGGGTNGAPPRLVISRSRFENNSVVAAGALPAGSCAASAAGSTGLQQGHGAIVIVQQAAGTAGVVVASNVGLSAQPGTGGEVGGTASIHDSAFVNNTGGCGAAVSVLGVSAPAVEWNRSLALGNRAAVRGGVLFVGGAGGGASAAGATGAADVRVLGGSIISSNRATYGGAAFAAAGFSNFTLSGSELIANSADYDGGALFSSGSIAALVLTDGSNVSGNTAAFGGGVAYALGNITNLTLAAGSQLAANRAAYGGAVHTAGSIASARVASRSRVANNTAHVGGAFHAVGSVGQLEVLEGSVIAGNSADRGGVVGTDGFLGSITISGSSLTGNSAAGDGGGFYARGHVLSFRVLNGSHVSGNGADSGGGGVLYAGGFIGELLVADGSDVALNSAGNSGGVVCANGTIGSLAVTGGAALSANWATAMGGAVFVNGGVLEATVADGSALRANNASYGGALCVNGAVGKLNLTDGSAIEGNTALYGGAVFTNSTLGLASIADASWVSANAAANDGGAFFVAGNVATLAISNRGSIAGCQAVSGSGGGVFVGGSLLNLSLSLGSYVSDNAASESGGAVYTGGNMQTVFVGRDSSVSENRAQQSGGALFAGATIATLSVDSGGRINGNSALYGGAVCARGNITGVALTGGGAISNNTASYGGGGIYTPASIHGLALASGSQLAGNYAAMYGGAVHAGEGLSMLRVADGGSISGNRVGGRGSCGGAVYVSGNISSVAVSDGGSVVGNSAESAGGAVYAGNTLREITIASNSILAGNAASTGGAVYAFAAILNMTVSDNSSVRENAAATDGGAVYAGGAVWHVRLASSGSVSGNSAGHRGGALFSPGFVWDLRVEDGSVVAGNRAGATGGALHARVLNLAMLGGGSFAGNSAGQDGGAMYALVDTPTWWDVRDSSFVNNTAGRRGGAVYLAAASLASSDGMSPSALGGMAASSTAGPSAASASLSLTGSSFTSNAASGIGGALAVESVARVVVTNGSFTRNTASSGGALAVWDAAAANSSSAAAALSGLPAATVLLNVTGSRFGGNVAGGGSGGAVFATAQSTVLCSRCEFTGNVAAGSGGAIAGDGCGGVGLRGTELGYNSAGVQGGAVASIGCSSVVVANCNVTANTAPMGGGLALLPPVSTSSAPTDAPDPAADAGHRGPQAVVIASSSLTGNKAWRLPATTTSAPLPAANADSTSGYGGGIIVQGGVELVVLQGVSLSGNSAWLGRDVASTQTCGQHLTAGEYGGVSHIVIPAQQRSATSPSYEWWSYYGASLDAYRTSLLVAAGPGAGANQSCSSLVMLGVEMEYSVSSSTAGTGTGAGPHVSQQPAPPTSTAQPSMPMATTLTAQSASAVGCSDAAGSNRNCSYDYAQSQAAPVWLEDFSAPTLLLECPVAAGAEADNESAALELCRVREASSLDWVETPPARAVLSYPTACYSTAYVGTSAPGSGGDTNVQYTNNGNLSNGNIPACQTLVVKTGSPLTLQVRLETADGKLVSSVPLAGSYTAQLLLAPSGPAAAAGSAYLCFPSGPCNGDSAAVRVSSEAQAVVNDTTGAASWDNLVISGWPGSYMLVVLIRGPRQVPLLSVPFQLVGCSVGESLNLAELSLSALLSASCGQCPRRQVGLQPDPRPALVAGAFEATTGAATASTATAADPRQQQQQQSLKPLLQYAAEASEACRLCPALAACPGGPIVVPLPGYWHSAPKSVQIHRCPNRLACIGFPVGDGGRDWLTDLAAAAAASAANATAGSATVKAAQSVNSTLQILGVTDARTLRLALCQALDYGAGGGGGGDGATPTTTPLPAAGSYSSLPQDGAAGAACVLTGLAAGDPRSYAAQQCSGGYTGNLCAACQRGYTRDDSFGCSRCPSSLARTVGLGLLAFSGNVALILYVSLANMAMAAGQAGPEAGDILKVIVMHVQYLIIISRLNIPVPPVLTSFVGALSVVTGCENYIAFSYACLLPDQDSAGQAHLQVLGSLLMPCAVTAVCLLLWVVYRLLPRGRTRALAAMRRLRWPRRPSPFSLASQTRAAGGGGAEPAAAASPLELTMKCVGDWNHAAAATLLDGNHVLIAHDDDDDGHGAACDHGGKDSPSRMDSVPSLKRAMSAAPAGRGSLMSALSTQLGRALLPTQNLKQASRALTLPQQLGLVLMVSVFVLYPAWAQAALSIFSCYVIDRQGGGGASSLQAAHRYGYWVRNMVQECYTGVHVRMYVPIGVASVLLFCVAPPLVATVLLWTRRSRLSEPDVERMFGFLYRKYRSGCFWWDMAIQVQTLSLVAVNVFGQGIQVLYQALMLLIVLISIATINVLVAPVRFKLLHRLEFASLAVLSVSISLSLYFVDNNSEIVDGIVGAAISVILIAINAGVMIIFLAVALRRIIDQPQGSGGLRHERQANGKLQGQPDPPVEEGAPVVTAGPADWDGYGSPFAAAASVLVDASPEGSVRDECSAPGQDLAIVHVLTGTTSLPQRPTLVGLQPAGTLAASAGSAAFVGGTDHGVNVGGATIVDLAST